MFATLRAWFLQYALWLLAAVAVVGWGAAVAQTLRLAWLEASVARQQAAASGDALARYDATTQKLDTAAQGLLKAKEARDASFKRIAPKVAAYAARPAAAVECLDDDGLRIVTELGRGKPADPGAPVAALPD